jgi:hypothetical protein
MQGFGWRWPMALMACSGDLMMMMQVVCRDSVQQQLHL